MRAAESGFTPGEILIVLAIVGMLTAIAVPTYTHTMAQGQKTALVNDAHRLHASFKRYYKDHGTYPSTWWPADTAFDRSTLSPLSDRRYFDQVESFTSRLADGRVSAYDSPDIGGDDTQFWATLELQSNRGVVILVAHTDDFPLNRGTLYDGVFQIVGASVVPLERMR